MTFTLQMPHAGDAALEILGTDGRLVTVIEQHPFPAGNSPISWDGRLLDGDRAPSGVYFVRLVADGVGADTHRVVLIQ